MLQRTRIVVEVLALTELSWIHKYRYDNMLGQFTGHFYKAYVAFVEISHRRDDSDMLAIMSPGVEMLSQLCFRLNKLHELHVRKNNAQAPGIRDS